MFDADTAEARGRAGEKIILVREETKPDDIHGFFQAQGILTSRGGKTSHAAVVGRQMGRPSIVGAGALHIDEKGKAFSVGGRTVKEGDWVQKGQFLIQIDASQYEAAVALKPEYAERFVRQLATM